MRISASRNLFVPLVAATFLVFLSTAQALTVKSVGSVRHGTDTQVTVVFSDPVDPVSGATIGNYTFGGGITVTAASMMTGLPAADAVGVAPNPAPGGRVVDNQCVVLTVTGLAVDATATITVQNVQDTATPPNTVPSTVITFKDSGYAWADTGTPALAGKVVAIGTNGFDVFSAGSAQWASYDEVTMVYKQVTGDFDFQARVEFLDFSSHWARAGIMARESLNLGENSATQTGDLNATPPRVPTASRYVDVHGNPVQDFNENPPPPVLHAANNSWESHYRSGATLQGVPNGSDSQNATAGNPPYPNAWLRIKRTGDEIQTWHGSDGVNWDDAATRTADVWVDPADGATPKPLASTLFVGPAFSPETGNINAANTDGKNRLFLYQIRFTAITVPYVTSVDPNPAGVLVNIEDAPPPGTQVNTATVQLKFDNNAVASSATKTGTTTTVAYQAAAPFAPGSSHTVTVTFQDNAVPPNTQIVDRTITIPNYPTIPASYALAAPATTPGMSASVYQIDAVRGPGDENSIANAEQQNARGFLSAGVPYPNVAAVATADIDFVNWEQEGGDINVNPPQPDHFNSGDPTSSPIPNTLIPGIPGSGSDPRTGTESGSVNNNIVVEVTTYLQLSPGAYRFGVNSDDGFKVSTSPGTPDVFGLVLGSFNGGRGASDTTFDFVVSSAGYYPFRFLWWEGSGGANAEWFAVNLSTGQRVLINGPQSGAVKAFRNGQGGAHVASILPSDGFTGAETNSPIKITLVDGTTTVVDGSITLTVDGNAVTPTINNGATTTVTYNGSYPYASSHSGTLVWGESTTPQTLHTNNFSFSTRLQTSDDLPSYTAGSFWIEAEDFDHTGTPVPNEVNTMPYDVGAGAAGPGPYDGIGAIINVDYFDNGNHDNTNPTTYRSTGDPDTAGKTVDLATDNGPGGSDLRTRRPGGFDMTTNYKIGWGDSADWYNYTRKITPGLYTAMIALSDGGNPAGTPNTMGGTLNIVTAGVGTANQTLKQVGTFNGPSSGGWSVNNLVPLYAADGSKAAFKITSATTTLRFQKRAGDYDWFVLVPVTGVAPKITASTPLANTDTPAASAVPRDVKVRATIEDFSTAVVPSSVKVLFDGVDVTSTATVTKPADITTVTYDPGLLAAGSIHNYELRFTDNGSPATSQTNKVTFTVSAAIGTPGQFLIEAEDFNHDSGQAVAAANTMPYLGGAFANQGAVLGVDYNDNDNRDSQPYRGGFPLGENVNHDQQTDAGTLDVVRSDTWTMTANYKIGWTADGNWYNYTRTIPANTYSVWAALSHDPADGLRGRLEQVTSDPTQPNQTVATLGTFDAPTSGGWGNNNLVQMKDSGGNVAVVSLGGVQTLRFNPTSGDYDYLLLVPATAPLRFNPPTITGNQVTISWTGAGTLQQTPSLTAPNWQAAPSQANPQTVTAAGIQFYRLQQ